MSALLAVLIDFLIPIRLQRHLHLRIPAIQLQNPKMICEKILVLGKSGGR